jgi:hypothetical protein
MSTRTPYSNLAPGAGPDGGTLLGFLASLGALVAFTRLYSQKKVTLHWEQSLGWRGRILINQAKVSDDNLGKLHELLVTSKSAKEKFTLKRGDGNKTYKTITKIDLDDASKFLRGALDHGDNDERRASCSTYASWFLDQLDQRDTSSTKLCALTGGSQQNLLENALHLSGFHKNTKERGERMTTSVHLKTTLLDVWEYKESMPGCRWEAQEDRHSALRHARSNKTHKAAKGIDTFGYDGSICTQRGANRLGIEALACFPLMPTQYRAETPGFRYDKEERKHQFTWPIWEPPLSLNTVRVLFSHPELIERVPNLSKLYPLGVAALFRTTRITKSKGQVSFTIAKTP